MDPNLTKQTIPVAVVIISYNTIALTRKALRALYNSSVSPSQVIVVDNGSADGSAAMVNVEFPRIRLVENESNLGFAKANNQAIRNLVKEPFVWLLNSDTEVGKWSLEQLYHYVETHPKVGALGPTLIYPDGSWQSVGGYFPTIMNVFSYLIPLTSLLPPSRRARLKNIALFPQPIPPSGLDTDYVTGAAVMLRKKALDEVGLLAEDYFMYFEETDLCWRLARAGWERRVIPTNPVTHVYGGSFKTKHDPRRLKFFLNSLNHFVKKNYRGFTKQIILVEVFLFGRLSVVIKQLKNIF